jgi:hypothetical protein
MSVYLRSGTDSCFGRSAACDARQTRDLGFEDSEPTSRSSFVRGTLVGYTFTFSSSTTRWVAGRFIIRSLWAV